MSNILVIFLCLIAGVLLKYYRQVPDNAHVALNTFVIYLAIPALALYYIPELKLDKSLLFPVATGWILFGFSWLFFGLLGHFMGWSRKLTGALILTGGLGNTAFVGFPLIEALYGTEGLKTAVLIDQPGTFFIVSTLGIIVAALYSGGEIKASIIAKKVLYFPPFIGFVVALTMLAFELNFNATTREVFLQLSRTITPVALVSVGLQLKIQLRSSHWGFLGLGLFFKLILSPLLIYFLYAILLKQSGDVMEVCVLEAAMAPMVTAAIVASAYGLKPRFSSLMLSVGIPLSLITVLIWYWLIG